MKVVRFANQVARRYGPELSRLLGVPAASVTFHKAPGEDVASTSGTSIGLNPAWFKGANRRDAKGAIVHELTHAYQGVPSGTASSKAIEAIADAARSKLGLGAGSGYSSGLEGRLTGLNDRQFGRVSRGLSEGKGLDMPNVQPGPKPGRGAGHLRNTGANANSKAGAGAYAALSASQAQDFAAQAAGLEDAYTQALMAIKQQRGQVKAAAMTGRADVKATAISDMASTEGQASQAGILGSSVDTAARAGVLQTRTQGLVDVVAQRNDALAQLRLQKFGAQTALNTGTAELQAQQAAAEAELQVQRYQDSLTAQSNANYQDLYKRALANLLAKGKTNGQDPRGNGGNNQDQGEPWAFSPAYPGMGPRPGDPGYDWRQRGVGGPVHSAGPHPH
jgi:hypothetical protein